MSGLRISTGFAPFVATSTFSSGAGLTTKTFSLPAQTTQFVPPKSCVSTVLCNTPAESIKAGAVCNAFDLVEASRAQGVMTECYPPGYSDIFYPQATAYDDVRSFAYPGTQCISGWTRACTQTLTLGGDQHTQTWCCPSGYACDAGGARQCRSAISTSTNIWAQPDAAAQEFERVGIDSFGDGQAIAVMRLAFPLQGGVSAESTATTPESTSSQTTSAGNAAETAAQTSGVAAASGVDEGGLSAGAKAGVAVGAIAGALMLLGLAAWLFIRKRRAVAAQQAAVSDVHTSGGVDGSQAGGYAASGTGYGVQNGMNNGKSPVESYGSPVSAVSNTSTYAPYGGVQYGNVPYGAAGAAGNANAAYYKQEMPNDAHERKEMDGYPRAPAELAGTNRMLELP